MLTKSRKYGCTIRSTNWIANHGSPGIVTVDGRAVWLSAATGDGVPMLLEAIGNRLRRKTVHGVIHLLPTQGRQRAKLFELGAVLGETATEDGGWELELEMPERDLQRYLKRENLAREHVLRSLSDSEAAVAGT